MYQDFSEACESNSQMPKEDYTDTRACGCGSPMQQWPGTMQAQGGMQAKFQCKAICKHQCRDKWECQICKLLTT